ncbi:MAG: amidase domain-containing protein [Candidatus Fimivivens sp.]|nr:amidase domain-containing protein [Candidatus Fimivivens sp.]
MPLVNLNYDRRAAVAYANRWAYFRNPNFLDFSKLGGDCTNFASQCLLAGGAVMNYTPTFGWYYIDSNNRAPAWTGVEYLYNFLTRNKDVGPYASDTDISAMRPGDLVQLMLDQDRFQHTPVITEIRGLFPTMNTIYVAAHSQDANCRPLSSYDIKRVRFLHIEGIRYMSEPSTFERTQNITQAAQSASQNAGQTT